MENTITTIFEAQQRNQFQLKVSTATDRINKLRILKAVIEEHEEEIYAALHSDLRKSNFETAVTELIFTYAEINFNIKKLKSWMKPQRARQNSLNLLAKSRIYYEPKGVCLIISPWNYPFQLLMTPLVSAIAAGNCVILKPSELSVATSSVITKIIEKAFKRNEVACIQGDVVTSTALLKLPFDHIFFTGSTPVGKIVMQAAAQNLSTVTLELGGKSPTLIDETVNIKQAAEKIAWGKLINAGQTCIAPDYILIHQSKQEEFIRYFKEAASKMFLNNHQGPDYATYAKIINQKNYDRQVDLIKEATDKGAQIAWGGDSVLPARTIHPTLLTNLPEDCRVMQEEIFGPILPIIPYTDLNVAIEFINKKPKPLALYIFSESKSTIQSILKNTSSGGVCVNDVLVHLSNPHLPFGGVGGSGMGSYHGIFGFKTFSHERAVLIQSRINTTKMIYPPYEKKSWVLKLLRKLM